jgi:hypothetical protein
LDKREKLISELYKKYATKIRKNVYTDFFTGLDLKDDVVNRVFEIFLKKKESRGDPDKIRKEFSKRVYNLTQESIRSVANEHKIEIKIVTDKSIKDFYEKTQYYVRQGYGEKEAKDIVRTQESILRHRFVSRAEFGNSSSGNRKNPSDSTEDRREYYEIKPPDDIESDKEEPFIEKEQRTLFVKAQEKCFKRYRKNKGDKNYRILFDFHFNEINVTRLAEKYKLTKARMTQITKPGIMFILNCIKGELRPIISEVA